jgi:hypothetical protein
MFKECGNHCRPVVIIIVNTLVEDGEKVTILRFKALDKDHEWHK